MCDLSKAFAKQYPERVVQPIVGATCGERVGTGHADSKQWAEECRRSGWQPAIPKALARSAELAAGPCQFAGAVATMRGGSAGSRSSATGLGRAGRRATAGLPKPCGRA